MYNPNDVLKVSEEDWEEFKKDACKDELFYRGEGDLLDTAEGRSKFCRLNETSVFRKDDPDFRRSRYNGGHRVRRRRQPDQQVLRTGLNRI